MTCLADAFLTLNHCGIVIQVLPQRRKNPRHLRRPLAPLVSSRNRMELVRKASSFEKRSKFLIRREQAFQAAAGEIKVWRGFRVRGLSQHERIIGAARIAALRAEDR